MSSSVNEDQDQDQRNSGGQEDFTSMTIESLRARLLSERAISKTSRERADELANRVVELEEQLKLVSLQRKKAEKATADVLAILESNGISDASETLDSSSDQETTISDSKVFNDAVKRKETSSNFEVRRSDMEAYSSSEIDSSPSTGRSLSWKSSKDNLLSLERKKYTETARRRCSSFTSNGSLPKRAGKSCRRIRRRETRETRPESEDSHDGASMHDFQDNTADAPSENSPNCADSEHPANNGVKDLPEAPVSGLSGNRVADAYFSSINGQDDGLKRTLQHQSQTMDQYGAEDKAQREWEEKIRESSSYVLDLSDPGNRSDVTEERDEVKASDQSSPAGMINYSNRETELDIVKTTFKEGMELKCSNNMLVPPHFENGYSQDEKTSSVVSNGSPASEFAFPTSKGTCSQVFSGNPEKMLSESSHMCLVSNGSPGNSSMNVPSLSPNNGESLGNRKELALMPEKSSSNVESVLEALQQARLSLNQKLHCKPSLEVGSSRKAIEPSVPGNRTGHGMEIPVGCPGLFRLPTDYQVEATSKINSLGSNSALSLASYYPQPASDKFLYSPYVEPRSNAYFTISSPPFPEIRSGVHRYSSTPFTQGASGLHTSATPLTETRPGIPASRRIFEPALDAGLSSTSWSTYLDPRMNAGLIPALEAGPSGLEASAMPLTEIRAGIPASRHIFEPALDAGLSSTSRSTYLDPRMNAGLIPALEASPSSSGRSSYLDPHIQAGLIPPSDAGPSSYARSSYQDPQMNAGLILPRQYTYPTSPLEVTPQVSANERLPRNVPSIEFGMPSPARFSFYNDHIRPNMYK